MADQSKSGDVRVRDLEIVLRRAAELEARQRPASSDLMPERDVKQLAGEIGISDGAVDRALVELRAGALRADGPRGLSERLWSPSHIVAARTVPGPLDEVEERVGAFLTSQGFAVKRNLGSKRVWRRAEGALMALRTMFDASRHKLDGSGQVAAAITSAGNDRAVDVVLTVDLSDLRSSGRANAWGGGLLFGGLSLGAGTVAAVYAALLWLPIGGLVAAGLGYGIARASVSAYRKRAAAVEENVEGFLDELEHRQ